MCTQFYDWVGNYCVGEDSFPSVSLLLLTWGSFWRRLVVVERKQVYPGDSQCVYVRAFVAIISHSIEFQLARFQSHTTRRWGIPGQCVRCA